MLSLDLASHQDNTQLHIKQFCRQQVAKAPAVQVQGLKVCFDLGSTIKPAPLSVVEGILDMDTEVIEDQMQTIAGFVACHA